MSLTDAQYQEWLLDVSRDDQRILLIEADHSAGTVYLASDHWMSETYQPYDGWLVSKPYLEDSLDNFLGVGDFDAVNAAGEIDWLSLNFRGYRCRWYYGDKAWPKADFKRIATALIDSVRPVNGRVARFDLMDGGQQVNRTFLDEEYTSVISVPSTMERIMEFCGLDPVVVYDNVSRIELASMVNVTYDSSTIASAALKELASSIGAYLRFSQTGQLEVFIPEITAEPQVITIDDIQRGSISQVDQIPAYKRVTLEMFDGTPYSDTTGAQTGELDEEIVYKTVLRREQDILKYLPIRTAYHATQHAVWRLSLTGVATLLQVGDDVRIDHPELQGDGIVSNVQRAPLSPVSLIEVQI